jgi:hypothetical protein
MARLWDRDEVVDAEAEFSGRHTRCWGVAAPLRMNFRRNVSPATIQVSTPAGVTLLLVELSASKWRELNTAAFGEINPSVRSK